MTIDKGVSMVYTIFAELKKFVSLDVFHVHQGNLHHLQSADNLYMTIFASLVKNYAKIML